MIELIQQPIAWYIAGPLIGLLLPFLLYIGNKTFGVSSSFRHVCASVIPSAKKIDYFNYDWKKAGSWNLKFVLGIIIGGVLAQLTTPEGYSVDLSSSTVSVLNSWGISDFQGLVPVELFSWGNVFTVPGLILLLLGGFLVGFGARYAGGCTSGHAITGLATLQKASLIAVIGFFIGGLITAHFILPNLLGGL